MGAVDRGQMTSQLTQRQLSGGEILLATKDLLAKDARLLSVRADDIFPPSPYPDRIARAAQKHTSSLKPSACHLLKILPRWPTGACLGRNDITLSGVQVRILAL